MFKFMLFIHTDYIYYILKPNVGGQIKNTIVITLLNSNSLGNLMSIIEVYKFIQDKLLQKCAVELHVQMS